MVFVSCMQSTSGWRREVQSRIRSRRERMEFTFQVAIRMGRKIQKVYVRNQTLGADAPYIWMETEKSQRQSPLQTSLLRSPAQPAGPFFVRLIDPILIDPILPLPGPLPHLREGEGGARR